MKNENIRVYLCGPMNGCTDSECKVWREAIKLRFPASIDPMRRDYRNIESLNYREIVDLDKRDIRDSDIILVCYEKPSVGTSMEIFYAWTIGKPVIVWCSPTAAISPWMLYHSTAIVHSLEDVEQKIREYSK